MGERHGHKAVFRATAPVTAVLHDDGSATGRGTRNGMPDVLPYAWRPREAERDAEVAARVAAAKDLAARHARPPAPVTDNPHLFPLRRCDACGYRLNAAGHRNECGTPSPRTLEAT